MTYAGASPTTIVSTVLTTACHSVNQAISHVDAASERLGDASPAVNPRASNVTNGQT